MGSLAGVVAQAAAAISLAIPATALAQGGEAVSGEYRRAQYLVLLDDSGSMSQRVNGLPPTDPDRLAVFAVRALLSSLDESDEVALLRLNAAREEPEALTGLRPVAEARPALENELAIDGTIAAYAGPATDCAAGFRQAARLLNEGFRRGTPQVLIYLTDGACEDQPGFRAKPFLAELKSFPEDLFQFYLLRFVGRPYTRELEVLAERSGGASFGVPQGDVAGILAPFALAVARSQGYETFLLSPDQPRLSAHRPARRLRILAVAPGEGPALSIDLAPRASGVGPRLLGTAAAGSHRYKEGKAFRFAAIELRPGDVPVEVRVPNEAGWKAVAIPQYQMRLALRVTQGKCSERGPDASSIDVGGTGCFSASLENEHGRPLSLEDLPGRYEFGLEVKEPGGAQSRLPMTREGDDLRATLERVNLREGDWILRPVVRINYSGRFRLSCGS